MRYILCGFLPKQGPAHHAPDLHGFLDAQQTLYKTPTIRDAVEEQMDSAPLAGRFLYALTGLVCLTLVSYCFGEFAYLQMGIIMVTECSRQLFVPTT